MAEPEPGHPDELAQMLRNWLAQANESPDSLLPHGIDPQEWAVRQFIKVWRKTARRAIDSVEESLTRALAALDANNGADAKFEIECAMQSLGAELRDELGIYPWNVEPDE